MWAAGGRAALASPEHGKRRRAAGAPAWRQQKQPVVLAQIAGGRLRSYASRTRSRNVRDDPRVSGVPDHGGKVSRHGVACAERREQQSQQATAALCPSASHLPRTASKSQAAVAEGYHAAHCAARSSLAGHCRTDTPRTGAGGRQLRRQAPDGLALPPARCCVMCTGCAENSGR